MATRARSSQAGIERVVVDANIAVNLSVPGRMTRYSADVLSLVVDGKLRLLAPMLIQSEVVNAITNMVIDKAMTADAAMKAIRRFAALPIAYHGKGRGVGAISDLRTQRSLEV